MFNFILKIMFALNYALLASKFVSNLFFEPNTKAFLISYFGLGILFTPTFYSMLSNLFSTKVLIVDKETYAKELERKLKEKLDKEEEK